MGRHKNAVEKTGMSSIKFGQRMAIVHGRDFMEWDKKTLDTVSRFTMALSSMEQFPNYSHSKRFSKDGWKMFVRPPKFAWAFIPDMASNGIIGILEAAEIAWKTGDGSKLRMIANALEKINPPETRTPPVASPLDDHLLSMMNGSSDRGWKQVRFPTTKEVCETFPNLTKKTIQNRAKFWGITLIEGKAGRPAGSKTKKLINRVSNG